MQFKLIVTHSRITATTAKQASAASEQNKKNLLWYLLRWNATATAIKRYWFAHHRSFNLYLLVKLPTIFFNQHIFSVSTCECVYRFDSFHNLLGSYFLAPISLIKIYALFFIATGAPTVAIIVLFPYHFNWISFDCEETTIWMKTAKEILDADFDCRWKTQSSIELSNDYIIIALSWPNMT